MARGSTLIGILEEEVRRMKALMVSLLAYSTAATGALFGMWLAAKWPSPRWSQLFMSWGVILAVVAVWATVL
jgi:hypothetical protein